MMSKHTICSIIFILFIPLFGFAQRKIQHYNLEGSIGSSNAFSSGFGVNLSLRNKWGVYLGYTDYFKQAKKIPIDYDPGLCFGFELYSCKPMDRLYVYNVRMTRDIGLKSEKFNLKAEMGLSSVKYRQMKFTPQYSYLLGSNYYISVDRFQNLGISSRIVGSLPIMKRFGFFLAASSLISKHRSLVGIELGFNLGRLNKFKTPDPVVPH